VTDRPDPTDVAHWEAVEEASELLHEGSFRDALYALRDVAKADPRNPYAYHLMGLALYELGQLEPSRDAYRAAARLAPGYLGARVNLSHVLRVLGDERGALAEAQAALKLAPDDGDVFYALGRAHAAAGNRSLAKRYLEAFLKTNPELEAGYEARQILETLGTGTGPVDFEDD
jgi:tetratricopeptide (TPR) repeat protein